MQLLMQCILGFQTAIKTKLVEFGSYVGEYTDVRNQY